MALLENYTAHGEGADVLGKGDGVDFFFLWDEKSIKRMGLSMPF